LTKAIVVAEAKLETTDVFRAKGLDPKSSIGHCFIPGTKSFLKMF